MYKKLLALLAISMYFFLLNGSSLAAEVLIDVAAPHTLWFFDVWGNDKNNVYAVGVGGIIYHYDGISWTPFSSPALAANTNDFYAISGASASCIFTAGKAGTAFYYDGINWNKLNTGTNMNLRDILCFAWNDVYAVGMDGIILHYNGESWTPMISPTSRELWGIWGNTPNNLYAVGNNGVILHWDGVGWTTMVSMTTADLRGIWGVTSSAIYAVGAQGTILKFDGATWSNYNTTSLGWLFLNDIYGFSMSDIYAVGYHGELLHYDGISWTFMTPNHSSNDLGYFGIWGSNSYNVLAVGMGGIINYYDGISWTQNKIPDNSLFRLNKIAGPAYNNLYLAGYHGYIAHFDGAIITRMNIPVTTDIYDMWVTPSGKEVFAAGASGTILYYDGSAWSTMLSNSTANFHGIWGTDKTNIYAVGNNGTIRHYDGNEWQAVDTGLSVTLKKIWGVASNEIYIIGDSGTILRYDGSVWSPMDSGTTSNLNDIWGTSSHNIYIACRDTNLLHYDGATWSKVNIGAHAPLYGLSGISANDFYVAKESTGIVYHYNGTSWHTITTPLLPDGTTSNLYTTWADTNGHAFFGGAGVNGGLMATLYYYHPFNNDIPVMTPTISPESGLYYQPVEIQLGCTTPGAEIRYTLDGSEPSPDSPLYSGPFTIMSSCLVKARGYLAGKPESYVATSSYQIITDWTPPEVVSIRAVNSNLIEVLFNEELEKCSAEDISHFSLDNGTFVTQASLGTDQKTISLTVSTLGSDLEYSLIINGVEDLYKNKLTTWSSSFTSPVCESGLVGYWKFNEGVGNSTTDYAGGHNDGLLQGCEWTTAGHFGNAIRFTGNSSVDLGTSRFGIDTSNAFTVALWFCYEAGGGQLIQRGKYVYPFALLSMEYNCLTVQVRTTAGVNRQESTLRTQAGVWYHVALTFNSNGERIFYINGAENSRKTMTGSPFMGEAGAVNPLQIGNGFRGIIDEVKLYNRALSVYEVNQLYTGSLKVATPDISPAAGTYYEPVSVQLSCATPGAEIHFTLDGSEPLSTSPLYSTPFTISTGCTVKARGYKSGAPKSDLAVNTYVIEKDTNGPELLVVRYINSTSITLLFNERLDKASAEDINHYSLSNGIVVNQACLDVDQKQVTLTVSELTNGQEYSLTANGLVDRFGNVTILAYKTFTAPCAEPGLVGYWKFNEGAGNLTADCSGENNQGVLSGCEWTTAGRFGNAIRFTGYSSVDLGSSRFGIDTSNAFTVALWFYYEAGGGQLIQRGQYVYPFALESMVYNSLAAQVRTTAEVNRLESTDRMQVGVWYHVALTFNSNGERIFYINGVENSRKIMTGSPYMGDAGAANPLLVGNGFRGIIDEVRLYNRALSANEISPLYAAAITLPALEINPSGGCINKPVSVSITCPKTDATIYYTLDNTEPDMDSPVYTTPLLMDRSCTVKAIACKNGCNPSPIQSVTFTFVDPALLEQRFNLPDAPSTTRFPLTDRLWPTTYGSMHVCLWEDDKLAAISMTIDDNIVSEHKKWLALSEKYGWKFTWFVIVSPYMYDYNLNRAQNWEEFGSEIDFQHLYDLGQGVQAHGTMTINNLSAADYEFDQLFTKNCLESKIPGNRAYTYAYPAGIYSNGKTEITARNFISARSTDGIPNQANQIWYMAVNSGGLDLTQIDSLLDPSNRFYRGWISPLEHTVGNSTEVLDQNALWAALERKLDYIKSKEKDFWVGLYQDIALYGQERDTHYLVPETINAETISFDLYDMMLDTIYTYPLTVKIALDNSWENLVATQNGNTLSASIITHNNHRYALVKAVPDKGIVLLRKIAPTEVAAPIISPAPSDYEYLFNGHLKNNVEVRIDCITTDAKIYYTLDGSEPTENSLLYSAPFNLTTSCIMRVKGFRSDLTDSPLVQAQFLIDANTEPPAPLTILATDNPPSVIISFNEPIRAEDAKDISHYRIDPAVTVLNAVQKADGRTIVLQTTTLNPECTYTLTLENIRDLQENLLTSYVSAPWSVTATHEETGLKGYWSFDEPADCTALLDKSGNGNTGYCSNTQRVGGMKGMALRFDGAYALANLGSSDFQLESSEELTISFWANLQGGATGLIITRGNGYYPFGISLSANKRTFNSAIRTNNVFYSEGNKIINNAVWYQYTLTYKSGMLVSYINGQREAEYPVTGNFNLGNLGSFNETILGQGFNGLIDELKIYNRALEASEVSAAYNEYAEPVSQPAISPVSDTFVDGAAVRLSSTTAGTQRYSTLDGSKPDESFLLYSSF